MKKILHFALFTAILICTLTPCCAEEKKEITTMAENKKVLIAYYSWSGNTKKVAEEIKEKTNGTLFRIETVNPYPSEYRATTEQAKKEINNGFRPELKQKIPDLSQYDLIFIGSPNWWGTIAPAISSFLAASDLSNKIVIPFITHGGGGEQNTIKDLTAQCKGCNITKHAWIGYETETSNLDSWLKDLGF